MSTPLLVSENLPAVPAVCEQHLADGNLDGALRVLNGAEGQTPKNAELLSHRGRVALTRGDTDSASRDFSDALKLNPQCVAAYSGLARLQLGSGNVMEAEFNAYRALGLDAGNEDAADVLQSLKQKPNTSGKGSANGTTNLLFQTKDGPSQLNFSSNIVVPKTSASPNPVAPFESNATSKTADLISLDRGLTLEMGEHSYIHDSKIRNPSGALTHLRLGRFCSIATELTIIGYDHHHEWITTYPFLDDPNRSLWRGTDGIPYPQSPEFGSNKSRGDITIGNDVWIGYGVKLFKGITVGNGAVIGACSLVNKSVEPYTIVAGIPARTIRKRFSESEIIFLEKIRWWDWTQELINRYMPFLCSSRLSDLEKHLQRDHEFQRFKADVARNETTAPSLQKNEMDQRKAKGDSIIPSPPSRPSNGDIVQTPMVEKSRLARQSVWNFLKAGCKFFADAKPPLLSSIHLQNSRVVSRRKDILELMPRGGICAEIGTQTGNFAKQILSTMRPAKLHIYDIDFTPFDHAYFQPAIQKGVVELHLGDSASLLARMPIQHFDFIYIDGDHSYEGAVRDLEQAQQKIKPDGWIVCNDYTIYSPLEKSKYGVYRAVNEFCWHHGFEIIYLGLHQWSYHDVALRKMKPEAIALASVNRPPLRTRPMSPVFQNGGTPEKPARPVTSAAVSPTKEPGDAGIGIIQVIGQGDEMFTGDKNHYFGVGRSALRGIESALTSTGKPRESIRNILDLPCGHGRVMRFFKAAFPQAQITACDLNRGAVDFCAKTFAAQPVNSHVDVNQIPLNGKFDLIWSGSLLTHLRAEACKDFVRLFNNLVNPGGMIVFTLHGRWVERSLATNRYTYGLEADDVTALLKEYYETGFGYANYPGVAGYGISVCSPAFVLSQLVSLPDLKLVSYHEKGWDNHQDIICLQKQPLDALLGGSRLDV